MLFLRRLALVIVLVFVAVIRPSLAQSIPDNSFILPGTEVIPVSSETNGVDYELYVKLPKGYAESDKKYPLLVTLDADYQFAIAASHVEHLSDRGQAPEMIIVSIAYTYDPSDRRAYRVNRTRDYTPANTDVGGYGPAIQQYSGGGPKFADFIGDELMPFIQERYRINENERIFIGHSYGGLFGSYLLLSHSEIFNRYILVSPSLWFKDKMMLDGQVVMNAPQLRRKTYVYMGVGEWENQPGRSHTMVEDLNEFEALLRAREDPNLIVMKRVFEDETHASIFPAVLSTGIRHLFQPMEE